MCYFVLSFSLCNIIAQMEDGEMGREPLVAELLLVNINNKVTGVIDKSEPLEAYPSEGFR